MGKTWKDSEDWTPEKRKREKHRRKRRREKVNIETEREEDSLFAFGRRQYG